MDWLPAALRHFRFQPQALVHAGAHHGQEIEFYRQCGYQRMLMIEADPEAFQVLQQRREAGVETRCRALSDRRGPATFYRTLHPTQSSLLEPGPELQTQEQIQVECCLLSDLTESFGEFQLLVLDLQGAELRVLQSCPALLRQLELIITEVNDEPRYQGCPLVAEIDDCLNRLGFFRWRRSGPFPGCPAGDAIYVNTQRLPIVGC